MDAAGSSRARQALADALANSLEGPLPSGTPRDVPGTLRLPGKVTAIVGVRRAGKTMFVHQLRRERVAAGAPRALVPYVNFEDERLAEIEASQLGFCPRGSPAVRLGPVTKTNSLCP